MIKITEAREDEIDLIQLIAIIWKGKWKIIAAIIVSVIGVSIFNYIKSNETTFFFAETALKPISSLEENKYIAFNNKITSSNLDFDLNQFQLDYVSNDYIPPKNFNLVFEKLDRLNLFRLYITVLNEKKVFEDAIKKHGLIDAKRYKDIQEYNKAVRNLASSIKIVIQSKNTEIMNIPKVVIQFSHIDAKKWKQVLSDVSNYANEVLSQNLEQKFQTLLLIEQQEREFIIEDLSRKIDNIKKDYDLQITNRILYLKEQSELAKALGISKNDFILNQGISSVKFSETNDQLYLVGYEAIEKQIELINQRNNKNPFILGLYDLEKIKRQIEQDPTLKRLEALFRASPAGSSNNDFKAAKIDFESTVFVYDTHNSKKIWILGIIFGALFGMIYVIIQNSLKSIK